MKTELTPKQEKLAVEIASALEDMESLAAHRRYVQVYSESVLRTVLTKTLSVPESQIRKSRGALFTSLLRGYAGYGRY